MIVTIEELRNCKQMEFQTIKLKDQIQQLKAKLNKLEQTFKQTTAKYYEYRKQINCCKDRIQKNIKNQYMDLRLPQLIQVFIQQTSKKHIKIQQQQKNNYTAQNIFLNKKISQLNKLNQVLKGENVQLNHKVIDLQIKLQVIQDNQKQFENQSLQTQLFCQEKQLYQRVTTQIINIFKRNPFNEILSQILGSCQEISKILKNKIQIEYQLEKNQQQYQKQLINKGLQKELIERKKHIQILRQQLFKKKYLLNHEQQKIQNKFGLLNVEKQKERKLKNYSVSLTQQLVNKKQSNSLNTKTKDQGSHYLQKMDYVKQYLEPIYVTHNGTPQSIMEQMARQDRQHIQRLFNNIKKPFDKI